MLKFVVVLYRRADIPADRFHAILRDEHGPMSWTVVTRGTVSESGQE